MDFSPYEAALPCTTCTNVPMQSRSRLNTFWINQETGPFFFRHTPGSDVHFFRVIPSHILFPDTLSSVSSYNPGTVTNGGHALKRFLMYLVDKNTGRSESSVGARPWSYRGLTIKTWALPPPLDLSTIFRRFPAGSLFRVAAVPTFPLKLPRAPLEFATAF